jgi:hypothetical protein
MFNRGGRDFEGVPVSVEIVLEHGQALQGKVVIPPGRTLPEVLNGGTCFIEFEPFGGERTFISKSALRSVKPNTVPRAPNLWAGPTEGSNFDPFTILGLKPGSTQEQARETYLRLAKAYHPDRYAAIELPQEVRDYLSVMARRINAAYDAVEVARRTQDEGHRGGRGTQ